MSTLILIPAAGPRAPMKLAPSNRRLAGGLLISLLLHAVLLSLHFGIPGLRPGAGKPLSVVLAPTSPPVVARPADPPVAVAPAAPLPSAALTPPVPITPVPTVAQPAPMPRRGFTLRDPAPALPAPPAPRPTAPVRRPLRRRPRPRPLPPKETLHTEVIARKASEDPGFVLPQPQPETPPMSDAPEVLAPELAQQRDEEGAARLAAEEQAARVRDDAERELVQRREAEEARGVAEQRRAEETARQQLAEQERARQLAAQRRTDELAREQATEQQRALQAAEQRRAEELARRQLAEQQRAEQQRVEQQRAEQLAEQQRVEQQRAEQFAEQRRADELARQQLAEQQRAQQLTEQRRAEELARQQLAEQQRAQQLAEQRRAEELARQQLAEQQRAQQLADQRQAEERAQQAAVRQRADELARQQDDAARRLARQDDAPGQPTAEPGGKLVRAERGAGAGGLGQGAGGAGAGLRGLPGTDFGSRARELLRGIDIAKAVPPAMRAAEQAQQAGRRALVDAGRRDLPLRMYIDSVRQKIERNAIVSQTQLSSDSVRTDPVVSIAIRSDGSVEDVTILRSSGRQDIDEIVRRIVRLNARYSAFPANVAANYDVIELRRIWTFAGALRLVEEVR